MSFEFPQGISFEGRFGGFTRRAYYEIPTGLLQHQRATNQFSPCGTRRFNRRMMIRMYHCRAGTVIGAHANNMRSHVRRRRRCVRLRTSYARLHPPRRMRANPSRYRVRPLSCGRFVVLHAIDPPALLVSADHYSVPEIRGRDRSIDAAPRRPIQAAVAVGSESALCRVIAIVL